VSRVCLIQCGGGEIGKSDAPPASVYNVGEPLGLLCLDAELRRLGHEVLLLHPHVELARVLSEQDIATQAAAFGPELISYSAMTNQVPATRRVAERLKSMLPSVPSVIGGDHFSSYPPDLVHYPCFDFAVCGEGEGVLPWLLESAGQSPTERPEAPAGVYWKRDAMLQGAGRAARIDDIGALPIPTRYPGLLRWSEVGMLMWPPPSQQTGMISLYASRGCPYACSYCNARQIWGKGVAWREPSSVVAELRTAKERFGINTAMFVDLTFNSDLEKMRELCHALEEAKLDIAWYVLARPGNPNDRIRLDQSLLECMQRAGCIKIGFGVETVSPAVARALRRPAGGEYVMQLARWIDELGMLSKAFLIIGHPAEDAHYYEYLAEYMEQLQVDEIRVSFLTPFPGTPLWQQHKDHVPSREDYAAFTTFRPIIPHPIFSGRDLEAIRTRLLSAYYGSPAYRSRIERKVQMFPELQESFQVFLERVRSELSKTPDVNNLGRVQGMRDIQVRIFGGSPSGGLCASAIDA